VTGSSSDPNRIWSELSRALGLRGRLGSVVFTVHCTHVLVNLPLGLLFCYSVTFLHFSDELITLACDHVQIAIGQLAPFLFEAAFVLFPLSFYLILVHRLSSRRVFPPLDIGNH